MKVNEILTESVSVEQLTEEFDLIESIINRLAEHNGVDAEVIWEDLESLTEDELYAFAVTSAPIMESQGIEEGTPHEQDINDPLDPNYGYHRHLPVKRKIQSRLGQDERGDARVRAGQERSTHARHKPQLPESSMDDNAIWNRYGHYNEQDLMQEFPNLDPKDAQTIVNYAEYGWSSSNPQKFRDEVVKQIRMAMGQQGVAEGGEKDRHWSNKDMERLRRAETELDDIFGTPDDSWTKTKQSQIKQRIKTKPMAGPKGVLPEQRVAESEAWQKANNRDRTDGMSRKAVKTYRREHPGSKLQTAVTTKPSKLKRGSKASKRRSSYCSRSRGQMKMHNISCSKTPDKAICKARRRWNC